MAEMSAVGQREQSEEERFAARALAHFRDWLAAQPAEAPRVKRDEGQSGSRRPALGIRVPQLRAAVRSWLRTHPSLTRGQWLATLDALYGVAEDVDANHIEECLLAGYLLAYAERLRRQPGFPLEQLRVWLGQLDGWVAVDTTCQATFSLAELQAQWSNWEKLLRELAHSPNVNRQRAALVLPIGALREAPRETRLLPLALALTRIVNAQPSVQRDRDKRVVKALSWLLREACKQYAPQIAAHLVEEGASLPALVQRETRMKLQTGRKNPRAARR